MRCSFRRTGRTATKTLKMAAFGASLYADVSKDVVDWVRGAYGEIVDETQ